MNEAPAPLGWRLKAAWSILRGHAAPPSTSLSRELPAPGSANEIADSAAHAARLEAEAALARGRIEMEEARKELEALRRQLEGERAGRGDAVVAAVQARLDPVMADLAETLAQLALQRRLIDEGKPVQARDVAALAAGLGEALRRLGFEAEGAAGDEVAFDPALHQSLRGGIPAPGSRAAVRMPGFVFGGRLVRRAFVAPLD